MKFDPENLNEDRNIIINNDNIISSKIDINQ